MQQTPVFLLLFVLFGQLTLKVYWAMPPRPAWNLTLCNVNISPPPLPTGRIRITFKQMFNHSL